AELFMEPNLPPRPLKINSSLSGYHGIPSYQKLGNHKDFNYYVSLYDSEINYSDEQIARLIQTIKDTGRYDNSLIIFTADHGEGMGEHDYFFAHGENLYNSLIHVPLIMKLGNQLTGRRTDPVQHLDLIPTILNILGIKTDLPYRGLDMLNQSNTGREIFSEMKSPVVRKFRCSLIRDGLKLIYTNPTNETELYNIQNDFYEQNNLINNPAFTDQIMLLQNRLITLYQEDLLKLNINNKPKKLTEEELEKIKSLGYVE
ncbi:MAG: sulfatase-like hydrolase/transferase, partial [Sedimentisphaerales bacterium]|nr:sulfatase-like hydrolase/transferase [Sedimentisphaerales bacterium]